MTVQGKPSAVLVAPEDLESPEETLAVLSDRIDEDTRTVTVIDVAHRADVYRPRSGVAA